MPPFELPPIEPSRDKKVLRKQLQMERQNLVDRHQRAMQLQLAASFEPRTPDIEKIWINRPKTALRVENRRRIKKLDLHIIL